MGAVPLLTVACPGVEYGPGPNPPEYGMPPSEEERISGTVTSGEKPVPGFWVSILTENSDNPYTFTNENGRFELYAPITGSGPYTLFFQDVDGPQNGEYKSKTVQWTSGGGPLHIVLEPID
jgi:putative lipoprotein (rSAM/lipoprotein system)